MSGNLQAITVGATNLVSTLVAMSIIDRLGRKKLLLPDTFGLLICFPGIAAIFCTRQHLELLVWLLMGFIASSAFSNGAAVWVYISKVFPTGLRAEGQSLCSTSHWPSNTIISLVFPLMAAASGYAPFVFFACKSLRLRSCSQPSLYPVIRQPGDEYGQIAT